MKDYPKQPLVLSSSLILQALIEGGYCSKQGKGTKNQAPKQNEPKASSDPSKTPRFGVFYSGFDGKEESRFFENESQALSECRSLSNYARGRFGEDYRNFSMIEIYDFEAKKSTIF
jgi:hypothetical protein